MISLSTVCGVVFGRRADDDRVGPFFDRRAPQLDERPRLASAHVDDPELHARRRGSMLIRPELQPLALRPAVRHPVA